MIVQLSSAQSKIRRLWVDDQWSFSIVDIVAALINSDAPSKYWTAMKRREENASGVQLSTICRQLKLTRQTQDETSAQVEVGKSHSI